MSKVAFNPVHSEELQLLTSEASEINITDSGAYYTGTDVETALQEIGGGTTLDSRYLNESLNLSDVDDVATARTNLGLVSGGSGDIWVEKTGDTMTGPLSIDGSANETQLIVQANSVQTGNDLVQFQNSSAVSLAGVDSTGRLYGDPSNGTNNTVFGKSTYRTAATGTDNTIFGNNVGTSITSGARNVLIGQQVGQSITDGVENVIVGEAAGQNVTQGTRNFGLGRASLANITVGDDNVAIGTEAMRLTSGDSNRNIAIGRNALGNSSTVFNDSVGIGRFAGRANAGTGNTYIGTQAGMNQGTGTNNVMIGYTTGQGASAYNASGNVFIGYAAGQNETASNRLYIENSTSSSPLIYGEFDNDIVKINGSLIVNEGGSASYDTRVESDNYDALFIDSSNDSIVVMSSASGKIGFFGATAVVQQAELTDELTTITHSAPGTPDYAIADPVDSGGGSAFGFSTADEFKTVMSVIANLQTRVNELETKLTNYGLLIDAD